jgi:hypothetical protein
MDTAILIAIIGGLFALSTAILTTIVSLYRERSEQRRIRHEENRWIFELNNQRELELHRMRIRTYPEVFTVLSRLSDYNIRQLEEADLKEMAERINECGYGEPGLCMLPDTRTALFVVRDRILQLARGTMTPERFLRGPRTDLVELMRRDLNHGWSEWREFKSLIELNRERLQQSLEGEE